ncbi:hypothetical protein Q1695_000784 [Nippostrongylus brasiliensis]|nr:hypothetical protein Q1695_000784 [Nippostrongylus brasiliensis]
MPLDGEEGATRNRFYLVQIVAYWQVSPQDGWYSRCDCKVITELNHEVAFNPRLWYCYENFPSERNAYTYRIPRRHVMGKTNVPDPSNLARHQFEKEVFSTSEGKK